ncbi:MAG: CTP pyrophosphohydrolase [Candidatus Anoxychlamydiales bacterium]|nr:CTP pyrophosphohydrolase [Candidatus Anoxychlamydiales bacterium]
MIRNKPGTYIELPKYFEANINSVACIIKSNDKILFLKKALKKWSENLWGIPCGTVEQNEDMILAMIRELQEEIGLDIKKDRLNLLGKLFIIQNDLVHNIHHVFYHQIKRDIDILLSDEHTAYKWLTQDELLNYNLIPNQDRVLSLFKAYEI